MGLLLSAIMLVALVYIPTGMTVLGAAPYADLTEGHTYTFEDGTGTYYNSNCLIDGTTFSSSQYQELLPTLKEMRVCGWSFSQYTVNDNAVLRSNKADRASYPTGGTFRVHDADGFARLKPSTSYHVTLRYRVQSAIKRYTSGGNTLPADTARSTLKIGYGANVSSYTASGYGMGSLDTVVKTLASIDEGNTFIYYSEPDVPETRQVGVWYTEDFTFSTPQTFASESDHFALFANCYTGTDILVDDVFIQELPSVVTHNNDGTGVTKVYPVIIGDPIVLDTPVRDGYTFDGWYTDEQCTVKFTDTVYTEENCHDNLYAGWVNSLNCRIADFSDYHKSGVTLTTKNMSSTCTITSPGELSKNVMSVDLSVAPTGNVRAYFPLLDSKGNIPLESNKTYALTIEYSLACDFADTDATITIKTAAADNIDTSTSTVAAFTLPYNKSLAKYYAEFTTGTLNGKNAYIEVTSKGSNTRAMTVNSVKLTRVDDGMSYVRIYDRLNNAIFERIGYTGQPIDFPDMPSDKQYDFVGWYADEFLSVSHTGKYGSDKIAKAYGRWENKLIDFESFKTPKGRYEQGEDCTVEKVSDAYSGTKALKYTYHAAPNYFADVRNAVSLAVVYDKTTYSVNFKYRVDNAQDEVQLKFLTAYRDTRWSMITDYDEATYTLYPSEIGTGWHDATVYLTTNFAETSSDGLFMTFNPVVEGDTEILIDDMKITSVDNGHGVVAYLGENNTAFDYKVASVGTAVGLPDGTPKAHFASFNGWYKDEEKTTAFTSLTVTAGMNFVYSGWTKNKEDFSAYVYADDSESVFGNGLEVSDGSLTYQGTGSQSAFKLGQVENNTTYQIKVRYKATAPGMTIGLRTADRRDSALNAVDYTDEGNLLTVAADKADGNWHDATLYITTAFNYTIPSDINADEATEADGFSGSFLYGVVGGNGTLTVDDIAIKEVSVLTQDGASVLTDEAATQNGRQAMRFYFGYQAENAVYLQVDGQPLTLIERGVVFKNAVNSQSGIVTADGVMVEAPTLQKAGEKYYKAFGIDYNFGSVWDYDADRELFIYSVSVNGFTMNDVRDTAARGYLKAQAVDGTVYTFYSSANKTDVREVKSVVAELTDVDVHTFAGKNWNRYTIVRPKTMSYVYGEKVAELIDYAAEKGVTMEQVTEKSYERPYEILIGDTNRDSTALVTKPADDRYIIAMKGNKIIIRGGTDLATRAGVDAFINLLKRKDELGCGAKLDNGFVLNGRYQPVSSEYVNTFRDDFDGDTLDTTVWGSYGGFGQGWPYKESVLGGTKGYRSYGQEPVKLKRSGREVSLMRVENGYFYGGTAYMEPTNAKDIENNLQFAGIELSTFGKMTYKYGILEFKSKVGAPPCCTSFWINGDGVPINSERHDCMTEYDLIETYGRKNYFASCIHYWWTPRVAGATGHISPTGMDLTIGNDEQSYKPDADEEDLYSDWHIYSFIWTQDGVKFAFDGVVYNEYISPDWYKERMTNNIIVGVGMGSPTYGTVYDPGKYEDYYETVIDYISLYQIEDMGSRIVTKNG